MMLPRVPADALDAADALASGNLALAFSPGIGQVLVLAERAGVALPLGAVTAAVRDFQALKLDLASAGLTAAPPEAG